MASQPSLHSIAAFAAYSLHGIATSSALHRSIQCMASQHSVHSTAAFAAQHRSIRCTASQHSWHGVVRACHIRASDHPIAHVYLLCCRVDDADRWIVWSLEDRAKPSACAGAGVRGLAPGSLLCSLSIVYCAYSVCMSLYLMLRAMCMTLRGCMRKGDDSAMHRRL